MRRTKKERENRWERWRDWWVGGFRIIYIVKKKTCLGVRVWPELTALRDMVSLYFSLSLCTWSCLGLNKYLTKPGCLHIHSGISKSENSTVAQEPSEKNSL